MILVHQGGDFLFLFTISLLLFVRTETQSPFKRDLINSLFMEDIYLPNHLRLAPL